MSKKEARVGFRLEDDLMYKLQDIADQAGVSVSVMARDILARAIRARGSKLKKVTYTQATA